VSGPAARRLLARAVGLRAVDARSLAAARVAWGSWERLFAALTRERLAPLLGWRVDREDFPGGRAFKDRLRVLARETLAGNLWRRQTYEGVYEALARAGIRAWPLKGVDVAFTVYPSPACRPCTDVDILVAPGNYGPAQDVLRAEGFEELKREPRWWPGRSFTRRGELVDLHGSPAASLPRRGVSRTFELLESGGEVTDEFRLLVAVSHLQNHFFALPALYYFEAALVAARVSWEGYWPLARRWNAARATKFVLEVAAELLGEPGRGLGFIALRAVARPSLEGGDPGRGAHAALIYALSLDNPAAALVSGLRRPGWAREIITRTPDASTKVVPTIRKEQVL
jgi:hypothetical protein